MKDVIQMGIAFERVSKAPRHFEFFPDELVR
jgi:hypothetical protein